MVAAVFATLAPLTAFAASPEVAVTDGRMQVLIASRPAAGYFTVHNNGAQSLSLVGAQAPDCSSVMLHHSSEQGGMARMEMIDSVLVPPHGSVSFQPGGYHLMCMDPSGALLTGSGTETVTLKFADGGTTQAPFTIVKAGR
jgi:periplasmic copper chaperone A